MKTHAPEVAQARAPHPTNASAPKGIHVRDDAESLILYRDDSWLCRLNARVEPVPARENWARAAMLVLDQFRAAERVLESAGSGALPALRLLLRHAATDSRRPWHVLRIDARAEQDAVIDAGWKFALEMELGCELSWGGEENTVSLWIYGRGARSAIARAARHLAALRSTTATARSHWKRVLRNRPTMTSDALLFGLDLDRPVAQSSVDGVTFRGVDLQAVARRPLLYADTVPDAEVPLQAGEQCFIGEHGGRTIFRMWVGTPDPAWLAAAGPAVVSKRSRYVHDSHTIPEFRNRGIRTACLRWVASSLREQGVQMMWLHVMPDNAPAIRSAEKVGFRRISPPAVGDVATHMTAAGMAEPRGLKLDGPGVLEVVREVIAIAGSVRVRAAGRSMWPTIQDGSVITLVAPPPVLRSGQIVLMSWAGLPVLHRVVRVADGQVHTTGDGCIEPDRPTSVADVYAMATTVSDHRGVVTLVGGWDHGLRSMTLYLTLQGRLSLARRWREARRILHSLTGSRMKHEPPKSLASRQPPSPSGIQPGQERPGPSVEAQQ